MAGGADFGADFCGDDKQTLRHEGVEGGRQSQRHGTDRAYVVAHILPGLAVPGGVLVDKLRDDGVDVLLSGDDDCLGRFLIGRRIGLRNLRLRQTNNRAHGSGAKKTRDHDHTCTRGSAPAKAYICGESSATNGARRFGSGTSSFTVSAIPGSSR